MFWNSAFLASSASALTLAVSSLAGYGFEIFKSRFRERIFGFLLLMLSIPFAALMVPLFIMMSSLKLINTFAAVILPGIASVFIIFYFRQATKAFPAELRDAARIDGLKEWQIFLYVYLPVMRSTYAAAIIIVFMANWNNYLWPLIILQTEREQDHHAGRLVAALGLRARLRRDHGRRRVSRRCPRLSSSSCSSVASSKACWAL